MRRAVFLAAALSACAGLASAAVPSGDAVLIELPPESLAYDVGGNGFVVVGGVFNAIGALYWMPTTGSRDMGGIQATGVSRDGTVIVGDAFDAAGKINAAIWEGGRDWRRLGSIAPDAQACDLNLSSAYGTSDSGRVVVGLAWNGCTVARAFRWEEETGMVSLGTLNGQSTRANDVSGDGRVVVGWGTSPTGQREGAKWIDGRQEMILGPLGPVGEAHAANRDGSVIVGGRCGFGVVPTAWKWTQATGVECFPVTRPPWALDLPYSALMGSVSDDGRVVGGALSFGLDAQSVVWFDGETVFLRDYLRSHGVPDAFEGWYNTGFVTGVSNDGRILVGYGAAERTFKGFMVVLPPLGSK